MSSGERMPNGTSSVAASLAVSQNRMEKWKFLKKLLLLDAEEKYRKLQNLREGHVIENELKNLVANGYVFKVHRFSKYDPYAKLKENKSEDDDVDNEDDDDMDVRGNSEYFKNRQGNNNSVTSKRRQSLSTLEKMKTEPDLTYIGNVQRPLSFRHSLPNVSQAGTKETEALNEINPPSPTESAVLPPILPYKYLGNTSLYAKKDLDGNTENIPEAKSKKRRRREKHQSKVKEFRAIFPGNCRTTQSMREFIDRETKNLLNQSESPLNSKKNKALKDLAKKERFPDIVQTRKTTSAIFRDFKSFKTSRDSDKS